MKNLIITVLFLSSLTTQAKELSTFESIERAILVGKNISFVIDYEQCDFEGKPADISWVTAIKPSIIKVINHNKITASHKFFTLYEPSALGTPFDVYTKFFIDIDGKAFVNTHVRNQLTQEIYPPNKAECKLGKGLKVYNTH